MHFHNQEQTRARQGAFNLNTSRMCISSVTLMELIYGKEKSQFPERNLAVFKGFIARLDVLTYDAVAAAHSGQIRSELSLPPGSPYLPI